MTNEIIKASEYTAISRIRGKDFIKFITDILTVYN